MKKIIILIGFFFLSSCFSLQSNSKKSDIHKTKTIEEKKICKTIANYNKNSIKSISTSFSLFARIKTNSFKTIGTIAYNVNPRKMEANFYDYIFKSTISRIFLKNKKMTIFLPIEKKLYISQNLSKVLKGFTGISIDFYLLRQLIEGKIPLLKNKTFKKTFSSKKKNEDYIVFENDKYYETISIRKKAINKFLFINKKTKDKVEIYIKKMVKIDKNYFFKKIKIAVPKKEMQLLINFYNIKIDKKLKIRELKNFKISKQTKIYKI